MPAAARARARRCSMPGIDRQHHQRAGGVPREGQPARPWATLRTNGMSPSSRFAPPGVLITDIGTLSSFHSIAWCSKNTESPGPSMTSATGTTVPSI